MPLQMTPFYLPVTRSTAEAFLTKGRIPALPIERAGLFALMLASSEEGIERGSLSRAIADADAMFARLAREAPSASEDALCDLRNGAGQPAQIWQALQDRGIDFATEQNMSQRDWCGGDGRYTEAFQERCRDTFIEYNVRIADAGDDMDDDGGVTSAPPRQILVRGTSDQARIAYAVAAAPDEHFEMRGYAGSGKTHLVVALAAQSRRCVHLAAHKASMDAFALRTGSTGILSTTVPRFVTDLVAEQIRQGRTRWVKAPRLQESRLSLDEQAALAGLPSIAGETPQRVLAKIQRAIHHWCGSDRRALGIEDFNTLSISPADKPVYVGLAQRLWDLMFEAVGGGKDQLFTLRTYHLIKWLDLAGAQIPAMGTILVDESHDLSAPMLGLLDRYQEGWIVMGDPYQSITHRAPRAANAKTLTMVQSVRTGRQVMPLIRSVVDLHGERLVDDEIVGSRDHVTHHRVYARQDVLPSAGLRVYGTEWQMLEDALRTKEAGGKFRLLGASQAFLRRSVADAVELYKYGVPPTHQFHLTQFRTWAMFAQHLCDIGQKRIARLFERGFGLGNLDALFGAEAPEGDERITLGLLEHCKNLEFSAVVMSPCCFNPPKNTRDPRKWNALVKAAYVAMTRVRDELWIPGEAIDQLADYVRQSRASSSQGNG